jgi:predicted outer membrane repeat protein
LKDITLIRGGFNGVSPLENFGKLTLDRTTLSQTSTSSSPILNYGTLTIRSSSFTNNSVFSGVNLSGGVLYNSGGEVLIEASNFSSSSAAIQGGVIYNEGGLIVINGSSFSSNSAGTGGAIYLAPNTTASINNTSFRYNNAEGGGAIQSSATQLTLNNTRFENNHASLFSGGALLIDAGSVKIDQSQFLSNQANQNGGSLHCQSGSTAVFSSSFAKNLAGQNGGAIFSTCSFDVSNSTFSANRAFMLGGGAFYQAGSLSANIQYATIAFNTAVFGAGIYNDGSGSSVLNISRSIVAHNSTGNCDGVITSAGYNLANDTGCGTFTASGDQQNASLPLSSLGYYGGPTMTHYLQTGSAALNNIPSAQCAVTQDQRGVARPQNGACDSGALEFTPRTVFLPLTRK